MRWRKFAIGRAARTGVNARNVEPSTLAAVRIRLLDGAESWKYVG